MKKSERDIVFNKCGGRCAYCGHELQKGWHVDHIEACRRITKRFWDNEKSDWIIRVIGYSNPDANHIDNYMPSCPSCNINKHGETIEQFRETIAKFVQSLNLYSVQYKISKRYGLIQETEKPLVFYFETL